MTGYVPAQGGRRLQAPAAQKYRPHANGCLRPTAHLEHLDLRHVDPNIAGDQVVVSLNLGEQVLDRFAQADDKTPEANHEDDEVKHDSGGGVWTTAVPCRFDAEGQREEDRQGDHQG
mmetsp:Transcript_43367/g.86160  ORF Transcript_43367/g.86160 Transcript_43367/m.86160 type:complete len:117 (+) Transcript_43367:35-385(+)